MTKESLGLRTKKEVKMVKGYNTEDEEYITRYSNSEELYEQEECFRDKSALKIYFERKFPPPSPSVGKVYSQPDPKFQGVEEKKLQDSVSKLEQHVAELEAKLEEEKEEREKAEERECRWRRWEFERERRAIPAKVREERCTLGWNPQYMKIHTV